MATGLEDELIDRAADPPTALQVVNASSSAPRSVAHHKKNANSAFCTGQQLKTLRTEREAGTFRAQKSVRLESQAVQCNPSAELVLRAHRTYSVEVSNGSAAIIQEFLFALRRRTIAADS